MKNPTSNSPVVSPSVENSIELEHGILEGFIIISEDDDFTSLLDIDNSGFLEMDDDLVASGINSLGSNKQEQAHILSGLAKTSVKKIQERE